MEKAGKLLKRLPHLEMVELREQWFLHFYGEAGSTMSARLLRLAIAYRVEGHDFSAPQAPLENDLSSIIDPVNLENVLGDVQTNRRNLFYGRPPVWRLATTTSSHIVPGQRPSNPSGHLR